MSEVVHQATVRTGDKRETYIGLTATQFKARYRNHLMSFRHEKRRNETELSKHLWQLKKANKEFNITWKILVKAKSYTNLTKRCNLCTNVFSYGLRLTHCSFHVESLHVHMCFFGCISLQWNPAITNLAITKTPL